MCKQNGFQLDAALDTIIDELLVDEQYLNFVANLPVSEQDDEFEPKWDNLFEFVMAFVGFFMIHNVRMDSFFEIRDEFIALYV
jgi:hypothetical protein